MRITFKGRERKPPKDTWFAWRPVRTQCGTLVWLEEVRFEVHFGWGDSFTYYYLINKE